MSVNLPTTKQLRYFSALAAEKHFGRAAERCFVSQSAFSTAIKELESTLETQLVDRTNRRVTLTQAGREFAVKAQDYLHSLEELVEDVSRKHEPLAGKLRLGAIPTIAPFLLPRVLKRLRRKFPQLQLYLSEHQTAVLHQQLLDGDIDVALLALPMDPFFLAYRDGSKHVDPDKYNFARLQAGSVMLMEDGHCLREHALDACRLRNSDKLNRFNASSLLSLVEMIEADLAVSYLPGLTADSNLLKGTRVRMLPLGKKNYRDIGLTWRKGSSRGDEFRLLGEFIRDNR
jgi:LysR family hydrogen peroxide-inducible transcriptional activator